MQKDFAVFIHKKSGLILPRQVYYNKKQKHIRRTKDDETKENPGNHSSFDSINCICLLYGTVVSDKADSQ